MKVEWSSKMEQVLQQARWLSRRVDTLESTVAKQGDRLREHQTTITHLRSELGEANRENVSSEQSKATSGRGSEWSESESELDFSEQCSLASNDTADGTTDDTVDDTVDNTTADEDMYRDSDDVAINSEEKVTILDVRDKSQQWVDTFRLIINKVEEHQRSTKINLPI